MVFSLLVRWPLSAASPREHSVGRKILKNLQAAGFDGPLHLVNPNYAAVEGIAAIKDVSELPQTDLLVIAISASDDTRRDRRCRVTRVRGGGHRDRRVG